LLFIIFITFLYFSCRVSEETRVRKVSIDFLTALNKKDYQKAMKMGTPATKQMLKIMESFGSLADLSNTKEEEKTLNIQNFSCRIHNDSAHCIYMNHFKDESLNLVKVKGNWLVDMKKEDPSEASKKTAYEDSLKYAQYIYDDSIAAVREEDGVEPDTTSYFDFTLADMKNLNGSASLTFMLNNRSDYSVTHLWVCLYISDKNGKLIQKKDLMFDNVLNNEIPEGDSVAQINWQKTTIVLDKVNAQSIGEIFVLPIRVVVKPEMEEYDYGYYNMVDFMKNYTKFKKFTLQEVSITY
jgi:hypothetical protein